MRKDYSGWRAWWRQLWCRHKRKSGPSYEYDFFMYFTCLDCGKKGV